MTETVPNPASDPYRTAAPPRGTLDDDVFVVPYGGQERMRLVVTSGLSRTHLRVDPAAEALVRVDAFDAPGLRLRVTPRDVRLGWSWSLGDWVRSFLDGAGQELDVVLHPAVAWEIVVRGGASSVHGDLVDGRVTRVAISGGCSDLELELPRPSERVPIRVGGGASRLLLTRPADVGVSVAVHGGLASLRLDDQSYGALGGPSRLETPGTDPAAPGYDVQISGGASSVEVDRA